MKQGTGSQKDLIEDIKEQLSNLEHSELNHIQHVITTLKSQDSMHYFGRFIGLKENVNNMTMELGLQNENTYGVVQGGALYTQADVAIGYHILRQLKENEQVYTSELKMNFIKKGKGKYLTAKPKILNWGRKAVVAECSVFDEMDELIGHALGTFVIIQK